MATGRRDSRRTEPRPLSRPLPSSAVPESARDPRAAAVSPPAARARARQWRARACTPRGPSPQPPGSQGGVLRKRASRASAPLPPPRSPALSKGFARLLDHVGEGVPTTSIASGHGHGSRFHGGDTGLPRCRDPRREELCLAVPEVSQGWGRSEPRTEGFLWA